MPRLLGRGKKAVVEGRLFLNIPATSPEPAIASRRSETYCPTGISAFCCEVALVDKSVARSRSSVCPCGPSRPWAFTTKGLRDRRASPSGWGRLLSLPGQAPPTISRSIFSPSRPPEKNSEHSGEQLIDVYGSVLGIERLCVRYGRASEKQPGASASPHSWAPVAAVRGSARRCQALPALHRPQELQTRSAISRLPA